MDRREMKKRIKVELGYFLNHYGTDWKSMPNFWTTLEFAVFEARSRPPTKAEKMRFNAVRMDLIRELTLIE